MRKPYLLRSPDYDPTSGGIKVMYGLYGHLLAKGEIAYINAKIPDVPTVGIYPEIYEHNDLEADTVVRYILQTVGVMGTATVDGQFRLGPTSFPETDKIYVFSKIYDTFGVDQDHIMFLPVINMKVFNDQHRNALRLATWWERVRTYNSILTGLLSYHDSSLRIKKH